MTPTQIANVIGDIHRVFNSTLGPASGLQATLSGMVASKLYEVRVLAELLGKLRAAGYLLSAVNGTYGLKASPGPINPIYAHINVRLRGVHVANIWTDVEFVGLSSHLLAKRSLPLKRGEYHELDVLICDPTAVGRPRSNQVYVGVEAKHWAHIPKKLLREVLGVRRELSMVDPTGRGGHINPNLAITSLKRLTGANPPSHLVFAYSTVYPAGKGPIVEWVVPSEQFDIEIWNITV